MFVDIVLTPSQNALKFLLKYARGRTILYVPNGTYPKPFAPMGGTKPRLLFLGSFRFYQNLSALKTLLNICRQLETEGFQFECLIAGSFIEEAMLNLKTRDLGLKSLKILGTVSSQNLERLLSEGGIGLLPYFEKEKHFGGQRIKALDYLSHGLLVISGPHGITGLSCLRANVDYILAKTPDEMTETLRRLIVDPTSYEKIRKHGWKTVLNCCTWDKAIAPYVRYLTDRLVGE
jgi:glycosyltransferase involved in cell wall biosynthesis